MAPQQPSSSSPQLALPSRRCSDGDVTPQSSTGKPINWHRRNPDQLVDNLTQFFPLDEGKSIEIARQNLRFRVNLTTSDIDYQLFKRIKILQQFTLTEFKPTTEQQFEDWVDTAAIVITKNQICVSLFQDAWSSAAPPSLARHIGSIPTCETHEQLVDKVASLLYKTPTYVRSLEVALLRPQRQTTVFNAKIHLEDMIARYHRLATRWSHPFYLSDVRCIELALQTIPSALEEDVRSHFEDPTWDDIWKRSEQREERLKITQRPAHIALPSIDDLFEPDTDMAASTSAPPAAKTPRKPPSPCPICEGDHWKSQCKVKVRCFNCNQLGHISKFCTVLVKKDERGRIDSTLDSKPSGTTAYQRKDRTQSDKITTAGSTLENILQKARVKSKRASEKRHKERVTTGKRVHANDHRVAVSQASPDDESESASSDDESIQDNMDALQCLCLTARDDNDSEVVMVKCTINRHDRPIIADSGAARSLVNTDIAHELNLVPNADAPTKNFSGLGNLKGTPCHATSVTLGSRSRDIIFYIVDKPGLPTPVK